MEVSPIKVHRATSVLIFSFLMGIIKYRGIKKGIIKYRGVKKGIIEYRGIQKRYNKRMGINKI